MKDSTSTDTSVDLKEAARKCSYRRHHVDNDFDLMEALYEEALDDDPFLLWQLGFYLDRLRVAKNPEYTDKCLKSPAFEDLWDDILQGNWDATWETLKKNRRISSLRNGEPPLGGQVALRKQEYMYYKYSVDNDFDLVEAVYDDYAKNKPYKLSQPEFYLWRIRVAMIPEYTEKCLNSHAFADIHDDIVARLASK